MKTPVPLLRQVLPYSPLKTDKTKSQNYLVKKEKIPSRLWTTSNMSMTSSAETTGLALPRSSQRMALCLRGYGELCASAANLDKIQTTFPERI
jgi:hypothetical protein